MRATVLLTALCALLSWNAFAQEAAGDDRLSDIGPKAAAAYEAADGAALWRLGFARQTGEDGAPQNNAFALRLFRASCELDVGPGCASLGYMLLAGRGAAKDPAAATAPPTLKTTASAFRKMTSAAPGSTEELAMRRTPTAASIWGSLCRKGGGRRSA